MLSSRIVQVPTYRILPSHLFHCLQTPKMVKLPDWLSSFSFPKIIPKCLTSNPLSQIVTSNPRLQPDTHFAVDMFPYKKTRLFQKSGFRSKPPKKPGNTPLSGTYLSFLDIKTTVSTIVSFSKGNSFTSVPFTGTGKLKIIFLIQLPSGCLSGNNSIRSINARINSFRSTSEAAS